MSDATTHRAFFGDAEYAFRLTPPLIIELERLTGMGIGGFCQRLFAMDFRHADMLATIRLALIGGGMAHGDADRLVRTYAADHPIMHAYPLAVDILDRLWGGPPAVETDEPKDETQEVAEPQPEAQVEVFDPPADDDHARSLRNGYGA
ncbi:gene transfer agent family protein [Phreatobacter cathodiphilus]|uniref:Gene transfer agent family protein n=1 Tax=Phreatobacter cathodiphilus TaxID=1868589 RepID=A0A2S0N6Z8_9HYPH|nr:gene transfer agent family protein [Phreatobacter cathodiphilus]AVO43918.1 gene transfer agent family protein [Phreatobacter cathodiphilus]